MVLNQHGPPDCRKKIAHRAIFFITLICIYCYTDFREGKDFYHIGVNGMYAGCRSAGGG